MYSSANGVVISDRVAEDRRVLARYRGQAGGGVDDRVEEEFDRNPPQPLTPGAAQALSTSLAPFSCRIEPSPRNLIAVSSAARSSAAAATSAPRARRSGGN